MIELPEATIIAAQMNTGLKGKHILDGNRGNSPHKFAFVNRPPEDYAAIFPGKSIGESRANGSLILTDIEPGYTLMLGGGGERIIYHPDTTSLPAKYQLYLHFSDETYLTVTVQGWGSTYLLDPAELASHPFISKNLSPLSHSFSPGYFEGLFAMLSPEDPRSVKFFMISKPGVLGVGNGCLQDILWQARLHPRRRAVSLSVDERKQLYHATRETLRAMLERGGRDGDYNLYNHPGGYRRLMSNQTAGQPCPRCGAPVEKASYLGGAVYFCPQCQTL